MDSGTNILYEAFIVYKLQAIKLVAEHLKREEQEQISAVQGGIEMMDVNSTPMMARAEMVRWSKTMCCTNVCFM